MAGLQLSLSAGSAPFGTPLPGNAQALLNLVAAYVGIAGGQNFNGINFGSTVPIAANRGLPWFKTDALGNPLGLFSWNGAAWVPTPTVITNGPTGSRPSNPGIGTEYYDTTISCMILWNGANWTTTDGSIGDIKEVYAPDITTAMTNNPGWVQDTNSIGLVIGGAGGATGITGAHPYGSIIGEENHVLSINEMPSHTHQFTGFVTGASANGNTGPGGILSDHNPATDQATGGGQGHNTIQPTLYLWRLIKQS